jgi:hypothetical protein
MSGRRVSTVLVVALSFAGLAALLAISLAQGLGRELIHDEHQFVAPGALLAQRGLLPYVDYPYFHMPYLAFLYGGVFLFTDHLLLGARLVSVLFGWLLVVVVFRSAWRGLAAWGPWVAGLGAAAAGCLLFFNPLFLQAHALSWNHDGGVFFATLGMLCLCRASDGAPGLHRAPRDLLLAGICLAVATGIRLSYAPFAIPFALIAWRMQPPSDAPRGGLARVGRLALGGVLGSLPVLVLMAMAPLDFFFGNLRYPQLNTEWYASEGNTTAMTLAGKLAFVAEDVLEQPSTLALVIATIMGLVVWLANRRRGHDETEATTDAQSPSGSSASRQPSVAGAAFLCVPFAAAGALAPSPSWPQYYVAVIPFLVLGAVHGLASVPRTHPLARVALAVLVIAGGVAVSFGRSGLEPVSLLTDRASWEPVKVHAVGEQIRARIGDGLVFTEAPIYALEGGARIYGFHAVGPFTFRTGHLLTKEERLERGVYAYGELPMVMRLTPPDAILTGSDGWMAKPTRQYARHREFVPFELHNSFVLFYEP